ncbi:MAG: integration host factor subunit alpha [Desulfobacteraceae bacterium]|nr:integration host factor subunit alpha [Desulfobacteraceae bacterium]
MVTLTKAQIVEIIAKNGYIRNQSTKVIEDLIEIIKQGLEDGEDLLICGFGKFCVNNKKERRGRNPPTDQPLMLSPCKVITFKCSGN